MSTNYHTDPDEYMTRPDGEPIKFEAPPEVVDRRAEVERRVNLPESVFPQPRPWLWFVFGIASFSTVYAILWLLDKLIR